MSDFLARRAADELHPIFATHWDHPVCLYLLSVGKRTRRTMTSALISVLCLLGEAERDWDMDEKRRAVISYAWHTMNAGKLMLIQRSLHEKEGLSPGTVGLYRDAVMGVAGFCREKKLMDPEQHWALTRVKRIQYELLPSGRFVPADEINAMLHRCFKQRGIAGRRDAAIISLLYGAGLRREEAVSLNRDDLTWKRDAVIIRVRKAKGDREREVPLMGGPEKGAAKILRVWLRTREGPEGILCAIDRVTQTQGKRLSAQSVYAVLERRSRQAGIECVRPHDLRRSFATKMLLKNTDINQVRLMLGHSQIETTKRYDVRPFAELIKAAAAVDFP